MSNIQLHILKSQLKKIWESHRFVVILLCNILFVLLVQVFAPVRFETNDDVGMAHLASGKVLGHPDYHLPFINITI